MLSTLSENLSQSWQEYRSSLKQKIEDHLNNLVPQHSGESEILFEAARYSLLGGGKRLRSLLTLATAQALGSEIESALSPACALEMVHTYSLIHDDLPCMDDDDFRRGRPSLHKAFSEATAVLAGDFLLTRAFEILADSPGLLTDQKIKLVRCLAKGAGGQGMIAGQILDMQAENHHVSYDQLENIHRCKTGALISAAVEFGAIIGNANEETTYLLKEFASEFGLTFQIVDDILDVTTSQKHKGSLKSSDLKNNKVTYVSLLGLDAAEKKAKEHFNRAFQALDRLPNFSDHLKSLAKEAIRLGFS